MSQPPTDIRTCGRPTRSGKPCKARIYGHDIACAQHTTQHERELAESYRRGYTEGLRHGQEMSADTAKHHLERLERRIQELEQQHDEATRIYKVDGDQVVEVDGRYAYRWRGEPPLAVDERVLLPENWLSSMKHGPGPYVGTVTGLGTTYRGSLSFITARAPAEGQEQADS